jgi:hypothetical protein
VPAIAKEIFCDLPRKNLKISRTFVPVFKSSTCPNPKTGTGKTLGMADFPSVVSYEGDPRFLAKITKSYFANGVSSAAGKSLKTGPTCKSVCPEEPMVASSSPVKIFSHRWGAPSGRTTVVALQNSFRGQVSGWRSGAVSRGARTMLQSGSLFRANAQRLSFLVPDTESGR